MMKKLAVVVLIAALMALAAPAVAGTADPIKGRFTQGYELKNQPHRAYFQVQSLKDAEDCTVTLRNKTVTVSVDTDNSKSGVSHIWFMHEENVDRAVHQARKRMPDPSPRIVCHKES